MISTNPRLSLPSVTLCAVASVNVAATFAALERCLESVDFARCLFFTDAILPRAHRSIEIVPIAPLRSAEAYSLFLLNDLVTSIQTDHVLVVQWDGFILGPQAWTDEFLDYDYIGATWPQFRSGGVVGNGGFSLRSRRLLEACLDERFHASHPEDLAICRENRELLTGRYDMRFAPPALAERFSFERTRPVSPTFGFHGVFNMPRAIGKDAFWEIYRTLDDRTTIEPDFRALLMTVARGPDGLSRAARMLRERAKDSPRIRRLVRSG